MPVCTRAKFQQVTGSLPWLSSLVSDQPQLRVAQLFPAGSNYIGSPRACTLPCCFSLYSCNGTEMSSLASLTDPTANLPVYVQLLPPIKVDSILRSCHEDAIPSRAKQSCAWYTSRPRDPVMLTPRRNWL